MDNNIKYYNNWDEYIGDLRDWVNQAKMWNSTCSFMCSNLLYMQPQLTPTTTTRIQPSTQQQTTDPAHSRGKNILQNRVTSHLT